MPTINHHPLDPSPFIFPISDSLSIVYVVLPLSVFSSPSHRREEDTTSPPSSDWRGKKTDNKPTVKKNSFKMSDTLHGSFKIHVDQSNPHSDKKSGEKKTENLKKFSNELENVKENSKTVTKSIDKASPAVGIPAVPVKVGVAQLNDYERETKRKAYIAIILTLIVIAAIIYPLLRMEEEFYDEKFTLW